MSITRNKTTSQLASSSKRTVTSFAALVLVVMMLISTAVFAGNLDSPAAPTDANSAMFTLKDIYNRLLSGIDGVKRSAGFVEPAGAPGITMYNLNQIMEKAPTADEANGATSDHVLLGKKYWGLKTGAGKWGLLTGTLQTHTLSAASDTVAAGNYAATTLATVDPDLVTGNIKAGTTIFGVTGDANVVNTSSGNATAGELLLNQKAWVGGQEITGTRTGGVVLKSGGTFSAAKRWYDNGDGTITDTTSGLIWLKNVGAITVDPVVFCASNSHDVFILVAGLGNGIAGLSDGSASGDWRVPTAKEMARLTSGTEAVLFATPGMFIGIADRTYWTVTMGGAGSQVRVFSFSTNLFGDRSKNVVANTCYVMPVRSNY